MTDDDYVSLAGLDLAGVTVEEAHLLLDGRVGRPFLGDQLRYITAVSDPGQTLIHRDDVAAFCARLTSLACV